ncbi:MAG: hypothetical protein AB1814_12210 [Thermodesulfobacteriota bacterium]
MLSRRRDICQKALPKLDFCLVEVEGFAPLTSSVQVGLYEVTKTGAVVIMARPFIDGVHVLMDVHNTTQKLVQVTLPGEGGEAPEGLRLWGDIVRFNRLDGASGPCFLVELNWIRTQPLKEARQRILRRLGRLAKGQSAE